MENTNTANATVDAAAAEYIARRDRRSHPAGSFDRAGRWYPAASEECSDCGSIRRPSRDYPYSLMVHCRTVAHVAALFGVDASAVRKAARAIDKAAKLAA